MISKLLRIPEPVALSKVQREANGPVADLLSIRAQQQATIDLYVQSGLIKKGFAAGDLLDASFASPAVNVANKAGGQ